MTAIALPYKVFAARSAVTDTLCPDWIALSAEARAWRRTDSGGGTALEQYGRYVDGRPAGSGLGASIGYFLSDPADAPDASAWAELVGVATGARSPHPFDLAIAWAAGWRPSGAARPASARFSDVAVLALVEQVQAALLVTTHVLRTQAGLDVVESDEVASMAAAMTMSLLGSCDCGHHRRGCGGACGRTCCFGDHDLRRWDPSACHLRPFIDQAVRGTAQRRILGGAFAESMLFRLLEAEGRLLCRTVEWGRCDICDRSFEGVRCPAAHGAHSRPRREPRKNQIIVPAAHAGRGHVPVRRWWCAACSHLHGAAVARRHDGADCPRCGSASSVSKAVWTLAGGARQPGTTWELTDRPGAA